MRRYALLLMLGAALLAGCGGDGSVSPAPTPDLTLKTRAKQGLVTSLRLLVNKGDPELGLMQKPSPIGGTDTVPVYDPIRGLWKLQEVRVETPEGPDGISYVYQQTINVAYSTTEDMSAPAGSRLDFSEQNEFYMTDTRDITETLIAGPLAGYTLVKEFDTSMSTSETFGEVVATHPSWGEYRSSFHPYGYITTLKKDGKEDKWTFESDMQFMTMEFSDGMKLEFTEGDEVSSEGRGSGVVKNAAGETIAEFSWLGNVGTIHWEDGEDQEFAIWPSA